MDEDLQSIQEARIRLEERDMNQTEDIKENKRLIEQLFDYKNSTQRDLTVLKTEKKFVPYIIMIVSAVIAVASVVWQVLKALSVGG
jgi:hypothetical protein